MGEPLIDIFFKNNSFSLFYTYSVQVEIDADSMGDQILPSFYAEDTTNAMNAERRRDALAKFLR